MSEVESLKTLQESATSSVVCLSISKTLHVLKDEACLDEQDSRGDRSLWANKRLTFLSKQDTIDLYFLKTTYVLETFLK